MQKGKYTLVLLSIFSSYACASDYTGFIPFMYLLIVVSITSAINIGLIITFYVSGKYENSSFANRHAGIVATIPIIGILLILADHRTTRDLLFCLGLNGLAALIALSPIFINKLNIKKVADTGVGTLILSVLFCFISVLIFAPLSIAAILSGHLAINNNEGNKRILSIIIVVLSYASLIHWLTFIVDSF